MASSYCPDCGERACNRGVCSNCQEELYIYEFQGEYRDEPLSDEFMEQAAEQRRYLNQRELSEDRQ
jgi:hypothetical protein